jgi:hypothetical protein
MKWCGTMVIGKLGGLDVVVFILFMSSVGIAALSPSRRAVT